MSHVKFFSRCLLVCLAMAMISTLAIAQTYSKVPRNDSLLLITRAVQCQKPSTCPDSVWVFWEYGRDGRYFRRFAARGTDTVVVKRGLTGDLIATPYYGEYRTKKGTAITVPSMPVDSITDVMARGANGWVKLASRDITITAGDTLLFVRYLKLHNGMRIRPFTSPPWGIGDTTSVLRVVKKNALQDSLWVVGR